MASRSIICRSQRLRQIIDLRDTDESRYFAITEFNNCFIIRSLSLFFNKYLWKAVSACCLQGVMSWPEITQTSKEQAWFHLRMSSIVFAAKNSQSQTKLNDIAHEHTIICRQLFAGHVVGSRPMKRKKHLHRMIILLIQ